MNRKKLLLPLLLPILVLTSVFGLWQLGRGAIGLLSASAAVPTVPARLVVRVDVGGYPADTEAACRYTAQEDLNTLLALLRDLPTPEAAPGAPAPENAAFFRSVTLTYADGSSAIRYIIEDRILRTEQGASQIIDPATLARLTEFLDTHPGESGEKETA